MAVVVARRRRVRCSQLLKSGPWNLAPRLPAAGAGAGDRERGKS